METKKANAKRDIEIKGYSANQSVDVRKGYNPQQTTELRNTQPIREGYNAQQMVNVANQPSQQQNSSPQKSIKKSNEQK
jgi:hypothetical protein